MKEKIEFIKLTSMEDLPENIKKILENHRSLGNWDINFYKSVKVDNKIYFIEMFENGAYEKEFKNTETDMKIMILCDAIIENDAVKKNIHGYHDMGDGSSPVHERQMTLKDLFREKMEYHLNQAKVWEEKLKKVEEMEKNKNA